MTDQAAELLPCLQVSAGVLGVAIADLEMDGDPLIGDGEDPQKLLQIAPMIPIADDAATKRKREIDGGSFPQSGCYGLLAALRTPMWKTPGQEMLTRAPYRFVFLLKSAYRKGVTPLASLMPQLQRRTPMNRFVEKHSAKLVGVTSGFDRLGGVRIPLWHGSSKEVHTIPLLSKTY